MGSNTLQPNRRWGFVNLVHIYINHTGCTAQCWLGGVWSDQCWKAIPYDIFILRMEINKIILITQFNKNISFMILSRNITKKAALNSDRRFNV